LASGAHRRGHVVELDEDDDVLDEDVLDDDALDEDEDAVLHAVDVVTARERFALGLPFHEYAG
jgi:hypothetical protein